MDNVSGQTPFTFAGQCDDEVIFTFDNTEKQLFVFRNFLSLISPVFRTMLTSDFIEKSTGVVKMKDKEYDNVLEFLLVLHPCVKKPITDKNVYGVLSIAEQYQIDILVTESKVVLRKILTEQFKIIQVEYTSELKKTEAAYACITVLSTALLYSYQDVKDIAMGTISKFGSKVFLKEDLLMTNGKLYDEMEWKINTNKNLIESTSCLYYNISSTQFTSFFGDKAWTASMKVVVSKRKECTAAFKELPDDIKFKILQNRLDKIEDNKVKN